MVETTARQVIIAVLIFTAILSGMLYILGEVIPADQATNFNDYNSSFNQLNAMVSEGETWREGTEKPSIVEVGIDVLNSLLSAGFGILNNVWSTVKIVTTVFTEAALHLQLPSWVPALFISIITITIAFAILAYWHRWNL